MIPYGRQSINASDLAAVRAVLESDWLTQGPAIERFEDVVADYCGAAYGVAMCNATSVLHCACLALDLAPGDWLWTSPNTFVASANCGLYCGARVDFVDTDPRTYNMSVEALTEKLEHAEKAGCLPKVVVPVHFAGQACAMQAIRSLADRYGFRIIEDASHAIGGHYRGQPVGCGNYADITVFSFHPVKIITTGEGGMAVTNNPVLAERLRELRTHGITRDPARMYQPVPGAWYYEQQALGYNYRMTDIQAALGISQMQRIDQFIADRHRLADRYDELLSDLPIICPWRDPDAVSAFHLYIVLLDEVPSTKQRDAVFNFMREQGVGVNVHYIPVYLQPYYAALGFSAGHCPQAENYYARCLSLPMFPSLTLEQQNLVVHELARALQ